MKIDFHSHVIPPEFLDAVAAEPAAFDGVRVEIKNGERFLARDVIAIKLRTAYYDLDAKLAAMDRMGIDVAVISCGPPAYCYGYRQRRARAPHNSSTTALRTCWRRRRSACAAWRRCRCRTLISR